MQSVPPAAPPGSTPRPRGSRSAAASDLASLIGYAAGALGILSFVWGFLSWSTQGGQGASGYSVAGAGAGAAIGLSIAAGLVAAAAVLERKRPGATAAALAVAAFLVTLGVLVSRDAFGANFGVGAGLILELVTTILQAAGLVYLWLHETGRVPEPKLATRKHRPDASAQAWPGGASQQGQYAPPPGQFPPAAPPGGYALPREREYQPPQPSYPPQSSPQNPPLYPPQNPPEYPSPGQHGGSAPAGPPPDSTPFGGSSTPQHRAEQDAATEQWAPPSTYRGSGEPAERAEAGDQQYRPPMAPPPEEPDSRT